MTIQLRCGDEIHFTHSHGNQRSLTDFLVTKYSDKCNLCVYLSMSVGVCWVNLFSRSGSLKIEESRKESAQCRRIRTERPCLKNWCWSITLSIYIYIYIYQIISTQIEASNEINCRWTHWVRDFLQTKHGTRANAICDQIWEKPASMHTTARHSFYHQTIAVHVD